MVGIADATRGELCCGHGAGGNAQDVWETLYRSCIADISSGMQEVSHLRVKGCEISICKILQQLLCSKKVPRCNALRQRWQRQRRLQRGHRAPPLPLKFPVVVHVWLFVKQAALPCSDAHTHRQPCCCLPQGLQPPVEYVWKSEMGLGMGPWNAHCSGQGHILLHRSQVILHQLMSA